MSDVAELKALVLKQEARLAEITGLLVSFIGADRTMSVKEVAEYFGCCEATVRRRAKSGELKNIAPAGKQMLFRHADLVSQKSGGRPMSAISLLG